MRFRPHSVLRGEPPKWVCPLQLLQGSSRWTNVKSCHLLSANCILDTYKELAVHIIRSPQRVVAQLAWQPGTQQVECSDLEAKSP